MACSSSPACPQLARLVGGQAQKVPELKDAEIKITTGGKDGAGPRAERTLMVAESLKDLVNRTDSAMNALELSVPSHVSGLTLVPAYRLAAPCMLVGQDQKIQVKGSEGKSGPVDDGSYYLDHQLREPCPPISDWMVVCFVRPGDLRETGKGAGKGGGKGVGKGGGAALGEDVLHKLVRKLCADARPLGMKMSERPSIRFLDPAPRPGQPPIEAAMDAAVNRDRAPLPQLVVAIISDVKERNTDVKAALTRWSVLYNSVAMVCMQYGKVNSKLGDRTFGKLNLLKSTPSADTTLSLPSGCQRTARLPAL